MRLAVATVSGWFLGQIMRDRTRWFLFSPVFVGAGIITYFSLSWQPGPLWLLPPLFIMVLHLLARRTDFSGLRIVLLGIFLISLGFAACILRDLEVAAPVLQKQKAMVVEGRVAEKTAGYRVARIILDNLDFPEELTKPGLEKIKLSIRSRIDQIYPGLRIRVKAMMLPPPPPAYAGGFDFQRYAYFRSQGATGYAVSAYEILGEDAGTWITFKGLAASLRAGIADQVKTYGPGETAGFIIAILTGDKGAIPDKQLEAMRNSGLAHLLAISGLHMGLVGGLIFFLARLMLACWPYIALNYPIKKISAVTALAGLLAYLVVSGMSVSAVRAYIMISAFFVAVCFDRTALSFRMVAIAALVIMILFPESLLSASFQMSFAAVFSLISLYELVGPTLSRLARSGGIIRRFTTYVLGVALTSLVAGLATAPFAIYHFGQMATFSLAANLVAVPVMGFWVMPWAIAVFLTLPLDWSFPLQMMGYGIDAILGVARETASWPQAVQFFGTFPPGLLLGIVGAGLWWMIWRQPLRWLALPALLGVLVVFYRTDMPAVIVSNSGNLYALQEETGGIYLSSATADRFEAGKWPLILGEGIGGGNGEQVNCDPYGCVFSREKLLIAFAEAPQALRLDCRRADIVISRIPVYGDCRGPILVIDKFDLWRYGSHSLYIDKSGKVRVETVNGLRGDRPWVPERARQ